MKKYIDAFCYLLVVILLIFAVCLCLFGCNPVKQVLKDPVKTDRVGREWEKTHGCSTSTTIEYLPGKTDTLETVDIIEVFDTTRITDSFETITPVLRERVITRIIHKTDTVVKKVEDTRRLSLVQKDLSIEQGKTAQMEKLNKDERKRGNRFLIFLLGSLGLNFLFIILLVKKK